MAASPPSGSSDAAASAAPATPVLSPLSSTAASAAADCAREPIHIPGGIQPHGYLFSIAADGTILQASENAVDLLADDAHAATRIDPATLAGQALADLIGESWARQAIDALAGLEQEGIPLYIGAFDALRRSHAAQDASQATPFALVVHRHEGAAFVELEPARGTTDAFSSMYPLVRTFINRLEDVQTVEDLAELAVDEVSRITGYGRTMVYNFDADGNGHVIAERLLPGYASYLGQRFPGSDIPAQARALYVRNRIRLIADANYQPARLVPPLDPSTGRPTDLTHASLRSVSPVHVQYMKNMGTLSSMSMSIVVRGKLWGLISCHHDSARLPPFEVRIACEHVAQVLSLQIEAKEDRAEAAYRLDLRRTLARLLATMANTDSFVDSLANDPKDLLELTGSTGAAIVFDGRIVLIGATPDEAQVAKLVEWLDTRDDIFSSDNLAQACPVLSRNPEFAGLLAVSISRLFRNYVLWFRVEVVRTVQWAGDPRAKLSGLSASLSPRESFDVWTDTVRDRSLPWRPAELEIAVEFRTALLGIVLGRAEELAQLALELGRANKELEGFSYTVSHDLRAPLRHIVGFADLLAEMEGPRLSDRGKHFVSRIAASARFGGKLVDDLLAFSQMGRAALRPQSVDLRAMVDTLIADEVRDAPGREIDWQIGALPRVTADAVLLHVVLRNLIENAVKFTGTRDTASIGIGCRPPAENESELAGQDVFFVRDNGVGFDMRYVEKLFGVFQRLHRFEDFEGTGIGLAGVKRIVERHGGKTWAQGKPEHGATLYFSLPRVFSPENTSQGDESAAAAVARLTSVSPGKRFKPVPKDKSDEPATGARRTGHHQSKLK
ncbi:ATP-binding protein [Paraburkholderia sp.]|uniref:ATP-binding protein n=1 Tax=Paraburkholderia sp. TaxID=1926495 RepID=UPI0023966B1A|nr:ATP-binding protein [Paraburkholderia sp.]MDE1179762.1 GAF domain-containing protein [Paraburkholderia sp.]